MGLTRQRRGCRGKRAWSEKRRKEWRRERRGGWRVEWTAEGARQREGNGTQKSMKDGETGVKTAMGGRGGNGKGERGEKDEWEEKRRSKAVRMKGQSGGATRWGGGKTGFDARCERSWKKGMWGVRGRGRVRKLCEDVWSSGKKKVWGKVGKGEVKCRNRSDMVPVQRERGERGRKREIGGGLELRIGL